MKGLLEKVQDTCKEVTKRRDSVSFGISNKAMVVREEHYLESALCHKGRYIIGYVGKTASVGVHACPL